LPHLPKTGFGRFSGFIPRHTEDGAVIAAGFQKLVELLCSDEAELLR
jgi:hypothetical protein